MSLTAGFENYTLKAAVSKYKREETAMFERSRAILVMKRYVIEPLGVMHLAGIAHLLGWDVRIFLYENFDFGPLFEEVKSFGPDLVGFSVWTGAHLQSFRAADQVRAMGVPVAIGGPHATYFPEECIQHADWVMKGTGFKKFYQLLQGMGLKKFFQLPHGGLSPGLHFDPEAKADRFPLPYRDVVYRRYPELGASPIKSIMCSTGCPFSCSYCNSPVLNQMYGGFGNVFQVRPIDDIVREALHVRDNWGVRMFYFQDDIFGYDVKWLKEFGRRWTREVGVPWHCQIRLELTRPTSQGGRLELFREFGCSGITLAIESGNPFLRKFVLLRPMEHDLIVRGTKRIMELGMSLRTEQILQVPFSNLETDLQTLALNVEINPQMAWTSILAPFGETNMGKIAKRFGFYRGNNDDLDEVFYFDYSQLRHSENGREAITPHVERFAEGGKRYDSPLLHLQAVENGGNRARVITNGGEGVCDLEYMDPAANKRYCDQTAKLQRIFNWLAKLPNGHRLGARWTSLPSEEWTWKRLGEITEEHLASEGYREKMEEWRQELATELGTSVEAMPRKVQENPFYFAFFPSSAEFARFLIKEETLDKSPEELFNELGGHARRWLFKRYVYKTDKASAPIAVS